MFVTQIFHHVIFQVVLKTLFLINHPTENNVFVEVPQLFTSGSKMTFPRKLKGTHHSYLLFLLCMYSQCEPHLNCPNHHQSCLFQRSVCYQPNLQVTNISCCGFDITKELCSLANLAQWLCVIFQRDALSLYSICQLII